MSSPLIVNKIAQLTGHNASVFAVVPGFETGHLFSAGGDGWIVDWDLKNPELGRLVAKVEVQVFSLLPLPDQNKIVAGNMNGGLHWVDLADPENTRNIARHSKGVFGIIRRKDHVLTIGGDGILTRWSAAEARSLESLALSNQSLRSIDFSPNRNELAIGSSDNNIYILNATTLAIKKTISPAHQNSVFSVKFAPSGEYLLSGSRDAHLHIWDADQDFKLLESLPAHYFTINDIVFHPEGKWFATGSRDKTIKIWDADDFSLLKVIEAGRDEGHINSVNRLFWSDYHHYLISASDDRRMIVWELVRY